MATMVACKAADEFLIFMRHICVATLRGMTLGAAEDATGRVLRRAALTGKMAHAVALETNAVGAVLGAMAELTAEIAGALAGRKGAILILVPALAAAEAPDGLALEVSRVGVIVEVTGLS